MEVSRNINGFSLSRDHGSEYHDVEKEEEEESGWTGYFVDFIQNGSRSLGSGRTTCSNSDDQFEGSSMVSDAASCAPWINNKVKASLPLDEDRVRSKRLSLKKRIRTGKRTIMEEEEEEDPLEDTASSPVNSPKVSGMTHVMDHDTSFKMKDGDMESNFHDQEKNYSRNRPKLHPLGRYMLDQNDQFTDLNKKGLCLLPLSIFTEYAPPTVN